MKKQRVQAGDFWGFWEVLEYRPVRSLCRCRCGHERLVQNGTLVFRDSPKCRGCAAVERKGVGPNVDAVTYRRMTTIVHNALKRCTDQNYHQWKDYGGRGIRICEEWLLDKKPFIRHLLSLNGHEDSKLVLDRVDNDGDYEPGNLRFVTRRVSSLNRRVFNHKLRHGPSGRFIHKN